MPQGRFDRLTHACFLLVGGVAVAVLVSWWLDLGDLTLPHRVARPMAPTTAWLLIAVTSIAWRRHPAAQQSVLRWVAMAAGLATVGFSLSLLVTMPWTPAADIPRGVMVPITAIVFLVIGVATAVEALALRHHMAEQVRATAGLSVAFSGVAVLFSHVLNVPFVAGQPLPALSTGVAFLIFGAGLVVGAGARSWPALVLLPSASETRGKRARAWAAAVVSVLVFVGALGMLAARSNDHNARSAALRSAGAAAETEARQISEWFRERQADAEVLRQTPLSEALTRPALQAWVAALIRQYGYRQVVVADPSGKVLITDAEEGVEELDAHAVSAVRDAISHGAVQFVNRGWVSEKELLPVSWVVPIGGSPARAVVVLSVGLDQPGRAALTTWSATNPTAETVIVGHDQTHAFFLNQPRLSSGPGRPTFALGGQMPVAVLLATSGQEGDLTTTDHRGVPVFAAVRQIAGTPWAIVTKVDQAGVYAAANETTLIMSVGLGASALAVILAFGLLWYRRELKTSEHLIELTHEQARADDMVRTLSTAVAQSPVSIVITDMPGTISYVNPMFTQVTGYTAAEVLGQNPRMLRSGTQSEESYRQLWETILSGQVWHGELHNKRKNGELFWEAATIAPLRDGAGNPTGFVAVKREITADKNAQEAHARLQVEFAQAQKMESVGRLAGGVAHDFNNMLAVILGHAELALEGMDDGNPLREHLVEILQAGQRSSDLTRQLLAFARKQKADPKVVDLNQEVTKTLKMLKRLIGENIELVWNPAANLWPIFIDPAHVDQILANVSVNARDAIPGVGTITIETANVMVSEAEARARPTLRPGTFVRLSIRDTGCGMPPEVLAHLFEPFFTTKAEGKGTGLGTATVYGIVTQNQGAIEVESAVGVGTTMRIYLPRAVEDELTAADCAVAALPRGTETILVVEDEAALLSICTRMLERLGYTVIACPSAARALVEASACLGVIHALLTDVVMPGMSGRDLAVDIAQRHPGMKVVFMSGYTTDVILQQGVLEDGVHFLSKPFSTSQLAVKMREVFQ